MIQMGGRTCCCVISTSCDLSHGRSLRKVTHNSCEKSESDMGQYKVVQVAVEPRKQADEDGDIHRICGKKSCKKIRLQDVRTNKQSQ